MFNHWVPLSILAGLGTIGFNTFNRHTLKAGHDATVYAWLFEVIRVLIFLPFLLFDYQLVLNSRSLIAFLLMGFTEFISVYLFMKMHAHSELSVSSVLSRLRIIWTPIISFFLLGEILSLKQYFGIIVIFAGCLLILQANRGGSKKGIIYALLFSVVNALSNIFVKNASAYASSSIVIILFSLPAVVLIPLLMKSARLRISTSFLSLVKPLFFASLFNSLTMYTMVSALRLAPAGLVVGVFQGVAMLTVFSGVFLLHEEDRKWQKLLAGITTTIGILLLI